LQVGRDAFVERLAFLAADQDEVRRKLMDFVRSAASESSAESAAKRAAPPAEADEQIRELLGRGDLAGLAELWMEGAQIDWRALYKTEVPARIPLPTYPFAKSRYWLPTQIAPAAAEAVKRDEARLHVVVNRSASALKEPKLALNSGELHE
jgi:acyl transferase domain-containing protein